MINNQNTVIKDQKGVTTILYVIALSISSILGIVVLIRVYILRVSSISIWTTLFCFFLVSCLFIVYEILSKEYKVSSEGIRIKNPRREKFIPWSEVDIIMLVPTGYASNNVSIVPVSDKNLNELIYTSTFQNGDLVAKAIADAALAVKPSIKLQGGFIDVYGPPPYGIYRKPIRLVGEDRCI